MAFGSAIGELVHATRRLRGAPGFTITVVGVLGLAIGALVSLFCVVNTVLLDPLPYAQPERLVYVAGSAPGSELPAEFGVAPEFYVQYHEQSRQLEDMALYDTGTSTLRTADRVERIRMGFTTFSLFSTLGAQPILGRLPVAADESRVVVLSHSLWSAWFGRDTGVLGRTVKASGKDRTVIGVMGPQFRFPSDDTMLWIPGTVEARDIDKPGDFGEGLVARMAPGATREGVARELTTLALRLPERFGGSPSYARTIEKHQAIVRPLDQQLLGAAARPLWILLAAAAIVLLIACANVANLMLVRVEGRHREMAMRRALGATRVELIRTQVAEILVVALAAGVLALALAAAALPAFLRAVPAGVPRLDEVGLDASSVLFTLAAAILAAVLCGILPAWRGSSPNLARLREGGRGMTRRSHWLRDGLVIAQTALALVLLIGSGLLVRSAYGLWHTDPGYDTEDVFTFQFAPDRPGLKTANDYARFDLAFLDRLAALPGVQSVGLVENVPLNEGTATMRVRSEGAERNGGDGVLLNYTFTAGDYFRTMRITLLEGRAFTADDHDQARGNVILSRGAADRLWPGQDALGRRIQREGQTAWETVVGVVDDVMQDSFRDSPQPLVYFPLADTTADGGRFVSSPAYVLRTARAETIAPEVRALVREVAPEAPMYRAFTLAGLSRDSMAELSFTLLTLGITAALSLLLGAIGLYGVLSYIVGERSREIGVRMALGARAAQVRRLVVVQGARVVGMGVGVGVIAALLFTRTLGSLLFGVQPVDPTTFALMGLTMIGVGWLASYLPARQASRLDPVESLRKE
ncbi:ADOP family duplicated permease [Dokdonella immobilis]|uniref:Duplicated orphan permease n=1 Tax=Dokdonella immobilis TaxID=578942 RepID=A0A1I4WS98_9GAMM|nr:ADOP family duplicated permease [Dokdonella immobilis]SFN16704.1 duplicated orphan permease [Dokdonella immobilis]